jgi:hypothetical protein
MNTRTRESAFRTLTSLDVVLCLVPIGLFVSILTLV